jgi:hypothetical protein
MGIFKTIRTGESEQMAKSVVSKTDVKTVVLTALGVFVAGIAMYLGRNIDWVKNATRGYDA